ncbi:MAG: DEAD/DEAH box helicase [Bacteroidota bacterium]
MMAFDWFHVWVKIQIFLNILQLHILQANLNVLTFFDLNLTDSLLDGLDAMGFETPTPIQQLAIPHVLAKHDLIACAQTGTGKTAAFVLPVIHNILEHENRKLSTLVIVPTRELAQQIDQQIEGLAYFTGVSSMAVYGGGDGLSWEQQQKALRTGVDVVIATPGRLLAMLTSSGSFDTKYIKYLVLDEADRMLDMGFYDDIIRIISFIPKERQTLLFSATMPPRIRTLAQKILHHPKEITIAISKPAEGIAQQMCYIGDAYKTAFLLSYLQARQDDRVIIFASTKDKVKELHKELVKRKVNAQAFHSDLEQPEREELMRAFKNNEIKLLIGTDILSRGIDVEGISLVVNYDVPPDPEDYVHRIGRTARAERTGTALTLVNGKDFIKFKRIKELTGSNIVELMLPEGMKADEQRRSVHSSNKLPSNKHRKKL